MNGPLGSLARLLNRPGRTAADAVRDLAPYDARDHLGPRKEGRFVADEGDRLDGALGEAGMAGETWPSIYSTDESEQVLIDISHESALKEDEARTEGTYWGGSTGHREQRPDGSWTEWEERFDQNPYADDDAQLDDDERAREARYESDDYLVHRLPFPGDAPSPPAEWQSQFGDWTQVRGGEIHYHPNHPDYEVSDDALYERYDEALEEVARVHYLDLDHSDALDEDAYRTEHGMPPEGDTDTDDWRAIHGEAEGDVLRE